MPFKRRGAETGSGFQEAINRANEAYERAGRACITRKAIPGKFLADRRRRTLDLWSDTALSERQDLVSAARVDNPLQVDSITVQQWRKFIPESKAEPDYGGTIAPSGRAIFYDAKTTRREVLDFDNLHAHQIGFLERMARLGAIAGFLVEFSRCGEVYFLPIQVLTRWRDTTQRKSLPRDFFVSHLTVASQGRGMLIYDYLAAIDSQEQTYGQDYATLEIVIPATRSRRRAV